MSCKYEIVECAAFKCWHLLVFELLLIKLETGCSMTVSARESGGCAGGYSACRWISKFHTTIVWDVFFFFLFPCPDTFYFAVKLGHFVSLVIPSDAGRSYSCNNAPTGGGRLWVRSQILFFPFSVGATFTLFKTKQELIPPLCWYAVTVGAILSAETQHNCKSVLLWMQWELH